MMRRSKSERRVSHAALKIFFEIYAAKFYIWFLINLKSYYYMISDVENYGVRQISGSQMENIPL